MLEGGDPAIFTSDVSTFFFLSFQSLDACVATHAYLSIGRLSSPLTGVVVPFCLDH